MMWRRTCLTRRSVVNIPEQPAPYPPVSLCSVGRSVQTLHPLEESERTHGSLRAAPSHHRRSRIAGLQAPGTAGASLNAFGRPV